jgi:diguanylate cyclase (GGDEF)-like protein
MRDWRKPSAADEADSAAKPSLWRLLVRDFRRRDDAREEGAARERVRALDPVPGFLLAIHIVCGGALLSTLPLASTAHLGLLAPLAGLVLGDLLLWAWVRRRPFSRWQPHVAIRCAALYALFANIAWCAVISIAGGRGGEPIMVDLALVCGTLAVPVGFMSFPALAGLGSLSCVAAFYLIWGDTQSAFAALFLALIFLWLTIQRAGDRQGQLRRRLESEWNAQRAARFIEEYEQGGHGWFWETSPRGALTYVSERLAADLKAPVQKLIGRTFTDLIDSQGAEGSERTLGFHLSARLPFTDITVRAAGAETSWSLSGTPIFDEHGRFFGFRGIGTDLSERMRTEEEINRLAKYDSLTGLPNRALMRRTLEEALHNAALPGECALFLIDLDRFKNVNDTLGHPIGDALLKQVGHRLQNAIGADGQIGRLGGDEFEAVLLGHDQSSLALLAERLIQQVSMPYMIEGHNISIGASVGIAVVQGGESGDALVRNADLALYSAKAAGRGTSCFFAPEMHSEARDRQLLENDLRKAIGRGELELYFQPVVNAQTEELSGFEALVRWNHPARGTISPSTFVPLAEECGLILPIGEWVLRQACAEAARWPENVRVAVNLSPIQFTDPSLPGTIVSALASAELPPRQLELEITEGVFLVESESTDDMFATLKSIGVRLALDDFGTGYSSLGYLKKTPFDKIKIDQSFVRGAARKDSRNAAIIRAIVTLAESLGMDTTAEGAETHDELTLIRGLGCSHIQGFIFGRPMPADEAAELARRNRAITADGFQFNRPPRQGLLKMGNLQWNGVTMPVRVRNLSTGGALLESGRALPVGASVQLDLPGLDPLGAEVRWAEKSRLGIQFDDEFDLRRLAPRAKANPAAAPKVAAPYANLRHADESTPKRALSARALRS